jgi:3-methyladenine DNA glycosylase AlkC
VTRKGAARRADIPRRILAALNRGEIETVTLVEGLAIDIVKLARHVVPDLVPAARKLKPEGVMARWRGMGAALIGHPALKRLSSHPSDMVRSWACYAEVAAPRLALATRLKRARRYAIDEHMGVREVAWSAARPYFAVDLDRALALLVPWVSSDNAYQRRFAIEGTRPRGVWCEHIPALKDDPAPALALLEPVRSDSSRYVQNATANWLNDASKTRPEWVEKTCKRWTRESSTKETAYIVKRALRTLRKRDDR